MKVDLVCAKIENLFRLLLYAMENSHCCNGPNTETIISPSGHTSGKSHGQKSYALSGPEHRQRNVSPSGVRFDRDQLARFRQPRRTRRVPHGLPHVTRLRPEPVSRVVPRWSRGLQGQKVDQGRRGVNHSIQQLFGMSPLQEEWGWLIWTKNYNGYFLATFYGNCATFYSNIWSHWF